MTGRRPHARPGAARQAGRRPRWLLLGSPLVIFATVFGQIYVTFLLTRLLTPEVLGQIGAQPAAFAVLIALVALPMHLAVLLAFAGRSVKAVLTGAEPPPRPARTAWRRFISYLVGVLPDVGAALIVFEGIADTSAAPLEPLLAVTVLGPIALFWLRKGLGALRRWGWRHWTNRGYLPQHAAPTTPVDSGEAATKRSCHPSSDTDP